MTDKVALLLSARLVYTLYKFDLRQRRVVDATCHYTIVTIAIDS